VIARVISRIYRKSLCLRRVPGRCLGSHRQNGDDRGDVWEVTAKMAMTGELFGKSPPTATVKGQTLYLTLGDRKGTDPLFTGLSLCKEDTLALSDHRVSKSPYLPPYLSLFLPPFFCQFIWF